MASSNNGGFGVLVMGCFGCVVDHSTFWFYQDQSAVVIDSGVSATVVDSNYFIMSGGTPISDDGAGTYMGNNVVV
jgi:hypothetical protein